jgi:hypothetical protein
MPTTMAPKVPQDETETEREESSSQEDSPLVTHKTYGSLEPKKTAPTSRRMNHVLVKTQTSMWEDAVHFKEGSIPHSTVLAVVIGAVCGTAAYVYYTILSWVMEYVWHTLPQQIVVGHWPEWAYVLWIPLVGVFMALGVGLTVVYMGEPGDLPSTIKCVHEKGYVAMSHVMPMVRTVCLCLTIFEYLWNGSFLIPSFLSVLGLRVSIQHSRRR